MEKGYNERGRDTKKEERRDQERKRVRQSDRERCGVSCMETPGPNTRWIQEDHGTKIVGLFLFSFFFLIIIITFLIHL